MTLAQVPGHEGYHSNENTAMTQIRLWQDPKPSMELLWHPRIDAKIDQNVH